MQNMLRLLEKKERRQPQGLIILTTQMTELKT